MKNIIITAVALPLLALAAHAEVATKPEVIDLGNGATLTAYLPEKNPKGMGVVICPGGGYGTIVTHTEGTPIAEHLVRRGIAGFVLKYRLPHGKHDLPGADARAAVKLVRSRGKDFGVKPDQVGIWGFSAGGHLAATTGTLAKGDEQPDYQILFYPVISMKDEVGHAGSKKNLLGEQPSDEMVKRYSLETQVTDKAPPTFLLHATSDKVVLVQNSLLYYQSLIEKKVDAVMHVYQRGGHGPGAFKQNPSWEAALDEWLERR